MLGGGEWIDKSYADALSCQCAGGREQLAFDLRMPFDFFFLKSFLQAMMCHVFRIQGDEGVLGKITWGQHLHSGQRVVFVHDTDTFHAHGFHFDGRMVDR